jgi:glucosamine--fructose-6-phosphate aminotransferase (isomerizing)
VDDILIGPGGPKPELPATRTYVAAMFRVIQLAVALASRVGSSTATFGLEEELHRMPGTLRSFLESFTPQAMEYATHLMGAKQYFVLSAGPNMSTAHEGALVLLQSTDAGASAFHTEEMLHGPIQALRPGMCVIAIAAPGPLQGRILQSAQACATIGATVLTIQPEDTATPEGVGMCVRMPPGLPELLTPLIYIVPFWLIGYHCALATGRDPDNLSRDRPEFKEAFRLLMAGDPRFAGAAGSR